MGRRVHDENEVAPKRKFPGLAIAHLMIVPSFCGLRPTV